MATRTGSRVMAEPGEGRSSLTFDELYHEPWWPMLRLAVGLVDQLAAAEDVVQDAFTAVYRRWDFIAPGAAVSYLRVSVVNASRSALRQRITARNRLRAVVDETVEAFDHATILSADHELVRLAMKDLPERQREVLTLRYIA